MKELRITLTNGLVWNVNVIYVPTWNDIITFNTTWVRFVQLEIVLFAFKNMGVKADLQRKNATERAREREREREDYFKDKKPFIKANLSY